MRSLHATGYSPSDIITTVFKVCKSSDLPEPIKVRERAAQNAANGLFAALGFLCLNLIRGFARSRQLTFMRDVGFAHVRIAEGNATLLQLLGLVGRRCGERLQAR